MGVQWPPKVIPLGELTRDDRPERGRYRDTGCDLHTACLTCPFERCRYDRPADSLSHAAVCKAERNRGRIQQALARGLNGPEIASETGLSLRTVYRHLSALGIRLPKGPRQRSRNIAFEHGGWR